MATLSGNKVKDTYSSLLKLESNGVTSTLKTVEDGAGTDSALKLSTDTVEVNGTLSFTTAPTTSSDELTGLFIDGSNNIVKRDLDSSAFSASTQVFANPMFILRPSASYTLTATDATPTQAGVNNGSNSHSHLVNDSSNAHLQTSSTTTGAVTVEAAGLIKIDVNFVLEVTASNTDITINVKEKASGGSASTIQSVVRSKAAAGNMAIGFSLIRHASEDMDIYYEISRNSSGGASLLTTSTFSITKLD